MERLGKPFWISIVEVATRTRIVNESEDKSSEVSHNMFYFPREVASSRFQFRLDNFA